MKKCLNDVSPAALIRAAREAVAGAIAGDFPTDPLIETELSRPLSCISSVIKRHGGLIEMGIHSALAASERFIVLPNVAVPLTKAADQLVEAKNSDKDLANIRLDADSESTGIVNLDLLVVDPEVRWAGAYEIKRGNGATEHGKRRPIIHKLRAIRPVLASYVKKLGHGRIDYVTSAIVDYYGGSGFDSAFTITGETIDDHFNVPVVATVELMTAVVREALKDELPKLFDPVFDGMTRPSGGGAKPGVDNAGASMPTATELPDVEALPMGPDACRLRHGKARH